MQKQLSLINKSFTWLTEWRFNFPLDAKDVLSQTIFPANLLASTETN